MTTWKSVHGVLVRGHRLASGIDGNSPFGEGTIALQMPEFLSRGIDLSNCYPGTLNVSIAPLVRSIRLTEPTVVGVSWHRDHPPENFYLSECRVRFEGKSYDGWIYYPDPSTKEDHFQAPTLFEIIAPFIPGVAYGRSIAVEVNPDEFGIT